MAVFAHTNLFKPDAPTCSAQRLVMQVEPSADTRVLVAAARRGIEAIFRAGFAHAKAGVMLLDLVDREKRQELFWPQDPKPERARALMAAVNRTNARMGRNTVTTAAAGLAKPWQMRRGKLSPQYTTCWDDLPEARA